MEQPAETRARVAMGLFFAAGITKRSFPAVIIGLESIKWDNAEVHVVSDSSYVVKALNEGWLETWKKKGFKGKKNVDLWLRFEAARNRHRVAFHWIKGHAGHPENERCDALAVAAYHAPDLPEDTGYISDQTLL